jgi:glycosyltransferase involved in cell wall biosynthesis
MVSVVVPIYNEEDLIVQFHAAVANALQSRVCKRRINGFLA